jgi:putative two-component system response regulator
LHDVGKLSVADEILEKLGPLTEEEWKVVKRHPEIGARMIEPLECLSGALPVIRHHHERPDGSGYPDGLEGDEIPLGARIVAVVDAYDEAGRQFDVRVVEAMGRLLGDRKTSSTYTLRPH